MSIARPLAAIAAAAMLAACGTPGSTSSGVTPASGSSQSAARAPHRPDHRFGVLFFNDTAYNSWITVYTQDSQSALHSTYAFCSAPNSFSEFDVTYTAYWLVYYSRIQLLAEVKDNPNDCRGPNKLEVKSPVCEINWDGQAAIDTQIRLYAPIDAPLSAPFRFSDYRPDLARVCKQTR